MLEREGHDLAGMVIGERNVAGATRLRHDQRQAGHLAVPPAAGPGRRQQGITDTVVPASSLVIFLVLAGLLGLVAASWPARRAARLDVLAAIAAQLGTHQGRR